MDRGIFKIGNKAALLWECSDSLQLTSTYKIIILTMRLTKCLCLCVRWEGRIIFALSVEVCKQIRRTFESTELVRNVFLINEKKRWTFSSFLPVLLVRLLALLHHGAQRSSVLRISSLYPSVQMASHRNNREGGELQDDHGNDQWHAGAGNSFAAGERACITASGKRCHEVDWREMKES